MSEKTTDFEGWAASHRGHFERRAKLVFKAVKLRVKEPALIKLYDAMEYALLGGGKRVRALLVYAAGDVTEAPQEVLTDIALAIEAIHAYSLVHDDLPCMDNDTLRRGKPTCHVAFGEAQALLAGDALQPFAFSILANLGIADEQKVAIIAELARAAGSAGMCGGQMIDLESVGRQLSADELERMHEMKTGALITAAVRMGALAGRTKIEKKVRGELKTYADSLGLAFQVIDDILDVTADTATLGKTAGKDEKEDKPTYVSILGLAKAKALAEDCEARALKALDAIDAVRSEELMQLDPETVEGKEAQEALDEGFEPAARLRDIAHYIIRRDH